MAVVSVKHLFDAGAHLGHRTQKWHPKMKEFIYGAQSGIYIIDLRKTLERLKDAYEYVLNLSANGGKVLADLGDLNGDGKVDGKDVTDKTKDLIRWLKNKITETEPDEESEE